jgi:glycosyltransferase involved in cell wall biosynthesis
MIKVSCIIPAYNEEQNISNTLKAVSEAGNILDEIIVVDDGSKDRTQDIVRTFPNVKLLINEKNLGKAGTIARGARESFGDYILMLDADLAGLSSENIVSLIQPIRNGLTDVVISMRENTPGWMKALGFDSMSGERVLPRVIFEDNFTGLSQIRSYGLEVFLNRIIIGRKFRILTVKMNNVKNTMKWEKGNFWKGVKSEFFMWCDLFKTVSFFEFVSQHFKMRKLLIKENAKKD